MHTNAFWFENAHFFMRFRLPSTLKTPMKTKTLQKWRLLKTHRFENAPFLEWTGENGNL